MDDLTRSATSHGDRSSRVWKVLVAIAIPCLSLIVFRPWVPAPPPVWDWSDLIPLFRGANGPFSAFLSVTDVYASEGRANFFAFAQLALTWHAVGDSALGWQMIRGATMLAVGASFASVLLRSGVRPIAAGLGGLILLLSVAGVEGWLYIMGEPMGVLLLIWFGALAFGYQRTSKWQRDAAWLAMLAFAVVQTKEVMGIALLPLAGAALCTDEHGKISSPRWNQRTRRLVLAFGAAAFVEILVLGWVLLNAHGGGYASAYGAGEAAVGRVGQLFLAMALPARFSSSPLTTMFYPANLLAVLLLCCGAALVWKNRWTGVHAIAWLTISPLLGAVAYAPWPRYSAFYGMPFMVASVTLIVAAADAMGCRSRARWIGPLSLGVIAFYLGVVADRTVKEKHALAGVAEDVAHAAGRWEGVDTVVVIGPERGIRRWPVTAGELQRYAVAIGIEPPITASFIDESCTRVADRLRSGITRVALVGEPSHCGPLPIHSGVFIRKYEYLDWLTLASRQDSIVVERLVPAEIFRRTEQAP